MEKKENKHFEEYINILKKKLEDTQTTFITDLFEGLDIPFFSTKNIASYVNNLSIENIGRSLRNEMSTLMKYLTSKESNVIKDKIQNNEKEKKELNDVLSSFIEVIKNKIKEILGNSKQENNANNTSNTNSKDKITITLEKDKVNKIEEIHNNLNNYLSNPNNKLLAQDNIKSYNKAQTNNIKKNIVIFHIIMNFIFNKINKKSLRNNIWKFSDPSDLRTLHDMNIKDNIIKIKKELTRPNNNNIDDVLEFFNFPVNNSLSMNNVGIIAKYFGRAISDFLDNAEKRTIDSFNSSSKRIEDFFSFTKNREISTNIEKAFKNSINETTNRINQT